MFTRAAAIVVILLVAAACGSSGGDANEPGPTSTEVGPTSTISATVVAPVLPATGQCLNPDETPYRSRFSEQAVGFHTEVRREIAADEGHWIFKDLEGDMRTRANVVLDGVSWNLSSDGVWEEQPIVPIRFPLLVWVNGYVTGRGVAKVFEPGERSEVAGTSVTEFVGGIGEMTRAFPGKMRGREFEPSTSLTYWVDDCGALLKADVSIELGGEEREIALKIYLPTTFRYQYEVYDIGADFEIARPEPGYLPAIPGP